MIEEYTKQASLALDVVDNQEEKAVYTKWEQSQCNHIYGVRGQGGIFQDRLIEAVHSDDFEEDDNCRKCGYDFWQDGEHSIVDIEPAAFPTNSEEVK